MNPWSPTSPCDPGCLPAPEPVHGRARAMRVARVGVRGTALAAVLVAGLALALVVPLLRPAAVGRAQQVWAAAVLGACGVRVRRSGPPAPPGALVVANHVSWLDVLALNAVAPVRMLAKHEVRQWPVLGVMAACAGTVFLDRDRLRALPDAVGGLADALRAGTPVGVFAEGTTRCGRELGPFRPAAFQAAHDAGAPVLPVAMRYGRWGPHGVTHTTAGTTAGTTPDTTPDTTAAFIGDDTLADSLRRVLAVRGLVVHVVACPVVDPRTVPAGPARADARRALARTSAAAVAAALPPGRGGHPAAAPPHPVSALPTTPDLEHVA
ncbi:lysophospholipid acyltransferase family protein [Actinomycetospora cinnamomea]|uniref:1-acyl-sn-glycerol-3-phosphate acyltransferase n=1 Tax=Actinomycetospora cinnamomea TaxID=663609 RepID=A0A2U1F6C4_9PSEU|nr:lysophospholipid acyltransferase family protein [Actinomycetospora cinnamomea]PVZ07735.1 lyso-ornithine lipid acyltransferase [Actinomycetospora cinnamomea]